MLDCRLDASYMVFATELSVFQCQEAVLLYSKVIKLTNKNKVFTPVPLENSYAANGIKHCVRPCDMTGKSAAIILRQMHHRVMVNNLNQQACLDILHTT